MRFGFYKLESAGNDYLYIDCFEHERRLSRGAVVSLCGRQTGVGADGVIFVRPSDEGDCAMDIYNSDGSRALMCGNGIRCVGALCLALGYAGERQRISTPSGVFEVSVRGEGDGAFWASVALTPHIEGPPRRVCAAGREFWATPVSVGNPHTVIFADDVDGLDLVSLGPEAEGCLGGRRNVEFVEMQQGSALKVRVWERGSGETLSCGTGAVAAALAAAGGGDRADVEVRYRGGALSVALEDERAVLSGRCRLLFKGETEEALWA